MSSMIRLVYASTARFESLNAANGIEPSVARILLQSRRNNPLQQIGGVLYYGNGYFFQCLEGASNVVNTLAAKIMQDSRHSGFEILKVNHVDDRLFKNWSMKYIPLESDVDDLLLRHGLRDFNPYEFSDELIDDMVALFERLSSSESNPDQDYRDALPRKPSFWQRFKSMLGF